MLYTSGTTGRPKGAILTHENLTVQMALLREAWGWSLNDTLLHCLPLHHMHGLVIAWLTALGGGAATHMLPFDAASVWNAMATSTVFMAVPTIYAKLFAAYDAAEPATQARWRAHAAHLRLATSGSAALPVTVGTRWQELSGRYPLERFGMTEIGVGLTNPLDGVRLPGHVGLPLPTVEVRVLDDAGEHADQGELWVRGPSVFPGYHDRPEETAKSFDDGWFRTGDTVTRDPKTGYFRILGRTSVDILKSGGYKLSALEIEEALREHGAVLEASVVGKPHDVWGDEVIACLVARPGVSIDEADVRAFMRARLAPYMVPKRFLVFDELPKNALGKVVKPELVKLI
jgi:malonyl-CoA/methylmalonyl-CoA synthetase